MPAPLQKEDLRNWCVFKTRSWRTGSAQSAGSVCHRLCHQTLALSTNGMHESKRQTFRAQTVKAQTVNNWYLLDYIDELNVCSPGCNLHTCAYLSCVHVLIHYFHCCIELKLTCKTTHMSWSVQPFLQGSRSCQTDRPTDSCSVCNNRPHLHKYVGLVMPCGLITIITSGQSYWEKRPHHRRTWTVQSYSPGCANATLFNSCFLGPTRVHTSNGISIGSAVFAQLTAESPITMGRPFSPHNCSFAWGI